MYNLMHITPLQDILTITLKKNIIFLDRNAYTELFCDF